MEEKQSSRTGIFPVHPKAFWALVPVFAVYVWRAAIQPEGAMHVLWANAVGLGLVLLVLSWLAYLISRRSVSAASLTFCIVCGIVLLGALLRLPQEEERADWRTLMSETVSVAQRLLRRAESDLDGTSTQPLSIGEYNEQLSESFKDLSDRLGGDPGRAALAMATVTGDLGAIGILYEDATRKLIENHPLEYAELRSSADVRHRLLILDRSLETCRDLIRATRELPDRLRTALRAAGMPARESTELAGSFTGGEDHLRAAEIRELDLKMLSAMREIMVLLDEHWELWSWNAEFEKLESSSDELRAALRTSLAEFNGAVEEQEAAQRLVFSRMKKRLQAAAQ